MALEVIAEVVVRVVAHVFFDILLAGVFYWPGWVVLRVVTLGRYPPNRKTPHNQEFVGFIGLAGCIAALVLFLVFGAS